MLNESHRNPKILLCGQIEKTLCKEEGKAQKYLDIAGVVIVAVDKDQTVLEINKKGCEILGYAQEEIIGKNWFEHFVPQKIRSTVKKVFRKLMAGEVEPVEYFENPVITKSGEERIVEWHNSLLTDENNQIIGVLSSGNDITERKRAEKELKENQRRLSTLISNLPGVVYRCKNNRKWTMEYISPGCLELTGYPPEDFLQNRVRYYGDLIVPKDRDEVWRKVQEAVGKSEPYQLSYRIGDARGREKWVWEQGRAVVSENGGGVMLEGFITDITSSKRSAQELRKSHAELRNLSNRLQTIREEEKASIAREIHDELGQALTALKMDLACLEEEFFSEDQNGFREKTRAMSCLIDSTISSIQRICMELRPQILDLLGLREAIEWQAREYERHTGIHCDLFFGPDRINLDRDRSTTCFRVLQEALTNVARHAKATKVQILLKKEGSQLVIEVKDNGRGIEEKKISDSNSLGLIGLRERVLIWGGEVIIKGMPDQGTTVSVKIPVKTHGKVSKR